MLMCPTQDNAGFHISGEHCGNSRTSYSHFRESEFSIDQKIIKYQIDQHCHDPGLHWKYGLTAFT